jgi:acetyl esterase/lipase
MVEVVRGIPFTEAGGHELLLDLYLPSSRRPAPAVVFLHGGGWRLGDRTMAPNLSRHFAVHGYVMVSIDYRPSSLALFPAQVHDVKAAVRWLRAQASEYAVDPDRIALWGSSAGGHLAAVAGLSGPGQLEGGGADREHSSDVAAIVNGYGPVDLLLMEAHRPRSLGAMDAEAVVLPPGYSADFPRLVRVPVDWRGRARPPRGGPSGRPAAVGSRRRASDADGSRSAKGTAPECARRRASRT